MKKVFENGQNIVSIFSLTQRKLTCQPKTNRLQKKIFDRKRIFFQNHQNIMKIVFLLPKATQL